MKTISKAFLLLIGILAFASCDADTLDDSGQADGDDGVIIQYPDDKDEDGIPDLPTGPL